MRRSLCDRCAHPRGWEPGLERHVVMYASPSTSSRVATSADLGIRASPSSVLHPDLLGEPESAWGCAGKSRHRESGRGSLSSGPYHMELQGPMIPPKIIWVYSNSLP